MKWFILVCVLFQQPVLALAEEVTEQDTYVSPLTRLIKAGKSLRCVIGRRRIAKSVPSHLAMQVIRV
jgi:hypothetical protein